MIGAAYESVDRSIQGNHPSALAPGRFSRLVSSTVHRDIFVEGEWTTAVDGGVAEIVNPATEQAIGTAAIGMTADSDRACAAARSAFDDGRWSGLKGSERSAALQLFHDSLAASIDEFAQLGVIETGALPYQSRALQNPDLNILNSQ
jgi:acyl-CoA reductase-like NAD-dependent aldehyde dehydrogenase